MKPTRNAITPLPLLIVSIMLLLVACDMGDADALLGKVTGPVEGYPGEPAEVVAYAVKPFGPLDGRRHQVGAGTVTDEGISFNLKAPPAAALFPATNIGFQTDDPSLNISILEVELSHGLGWFELGNTEPHKEITDLIVGDAYAQLLYADRPGTLNAPGGIGFRIHGGLEVREGWNVLTRTVINNAVANPWEYLGTGDLSDFAWYFLGDADGPPPTPADITITANVSNYSGPGTTIAALTYDEDAYPHTVGGGYLTFQGNLTLTLTVPPPETLFHITPETAGPINPSTSDPKTGYAGVSVIANDTISGHLKIADTQESFDRPWGSHIAGDLTSASLMFADRPVRLTYDYDDSFGHNFTADLDLEAGWNLVVERVTETHGDTFTFRTTVEPLEEYNWFYRTSP